MPVYKDNHCNRLAGRVGKTYGAKKKDKLHKAADKRGPAPARPRHTKGAPPPPPGKPPSKKRGPPPPPPGRPPSKTHSAKHLKKIRKGATYDKDHQKRLDSLGKKGGRNPIPPPPPKGKPPSKKRGPPPPPPGKPPNRLHKAADKRGKAPAPPKKAQGPASYSNPRGKKATSVAGTGKRTAMMPKRSVVPAAAKKKRTKRSVEEWKMPHILKKYAVGKTSAFFKHEWADAGRDGSWQGTKSVDYHGDYTVTKHTATGISFKNAAGKRKTLSYLKAGHTV